MVGPVFKSRLAVMGTLPRTIPQPRWDGSPLTGKTILVNVEHGERGLGDTIPIRMHIYPWCGNSAAPWFWSVNRPSSICCAGVPA